MPNHFHLLLKPVATGGIPRFISDISNSHARYFNIKYERTGRLFQETYKAKEISSEPSLMQVIRYIHLNPVFSSKTNPKKALIKPQDYPYSSYRNWIGQQSQLRLDQEELERWISYSGGPDKYRSFVESKIGGDVTHGIEDLILESPQHLNPKG
uniref:Transposase IS200-like domain-containing protein n=1 Tax=candidate division WWE3 bacterium TaxID=2053526 RepID=A0A832E0K3_UNCKA